VKGILRERKHICACKRREQRVQLSERERDEFGLPAFGKSGEASKGERRWRKNCGKEGTSREGM